MKKLFSILVLMATSVGLTPQASASLILETYSTGAATPGTIAGYTMTDFAFTASPSGTSTQVAAPGDGFVEFSDYSNNSIALSNNTADSTTWWNNGEASDYNIYTTEEHLIKLTLPTDTFAFSFNVGADLGSTGNNAWLLATETNGSGIDSQQWFNVNRSNTPGFGIYADNSNGSCSTITSITIEPDYWGVGNFSISRGSCNNVPEPSIIALFAAGLFGIGFARRRMRS
ncbi:MAG: hypothetical protein DRR06_16965 [Gammaproteobacteria bacterium]|nr:MAG: hypothetical protein DRR06_16965 [Gammaproteobacteria bacterium]